MKTAKLFSVLTLALIFIGMNAGFSKKVENPVSIMVQSTSIMYQVNIHMGLSTYPCDTYVVQIVDETGRIVAPPQAFVPGLKAYSFKERLSTVQNNHSRRIAMLVRVTFPNHFTCSTTLFAVPAIMAGSFLPGHLYIFDLYPNTQPITP
jgi:hypothetical protein